MGTSPLYGWVNKRASLPKRFRCDVDGDHARDNVAGEWSVSVALDEEVPFHAIADAKWQSLAETRRATNTYLQNASSLIDGLWGGTLDSEERQLILDELGEPPEYCLPIYLVSVGSGEEERIVYVGKTRSSKRFANGHRVGLKLHHPDYEHLNKKVYRCSVLLDIHDEYVALEWIDPEQLAERILDSVESVLIYALQPELNVNKRKKPTVDTPVFIHVQNFVGGYLLNNLMLWHNNDEPLSFCRADKGK